MEDWVAILAGFRAGEISAHNRVIALITGLLASVGAYQVRDSWDDLVQEVVLILLRASPRAEEAEAIVAFVRTTVTRCYVNHLRREHGRRRRRQGEAPGEPLGWRRNVPIDEAVALTSEPSPWERLLDEGVVAALERLDRPKQQALEAVYLRGMSYEEASNQLEMPLGSFKRLLGMALSDIRKAIVPSGPSV